MVCRVAGEVFDFGADARLIAALSGGARRFVTDEMERDDAVAAADDPASRPAVILAAGGHRRAESGHPWVYSNEIRMDAAAKALAPGALVTVKRADERPLGVAMFNPHSLLAARMLDRDWARPIGRRFLARRLERALRLRERLYDAPYYRLVHAEADGLPGLVIDRFGDVLVVQENAAGIERLEEPLVAALQELLRPEAIVVRNDSGARALEGLPLETRVVHGMVSAPVRVEEGGVRFQADAVAGQKTGWFYDQRDNRDFVAGLAAGRRVLDLYSYAGGFALRAAEAGAGEVLGIDSSAPALVLANAACEANGLADTCSFKRADVFAEAQAMVAAGARFDVVIADPPAFARSKRDAPAALRGYRKLARMVAALTVPGGFAFLASCSHNVGAAEFAEAVRRGLLDAGRTGRILKSSGAAPDHPVHPDLPESAYLKAMTLTID